MQENDEEIRLSFSQKTEEQIQIPKRVSPAFSKLFKTTDAVLVTRSTIKRSVKSILKKHENALRKGSKGKKKVTFDEVVYMNDENQTINKLRMGGYTKPIKQGYCSHVCHNTKTIFLLIFEFLVIILRLLYIILYLLLLILKNIFIYIGKAIVITLLLVFFLLTCLCPKCYKNPFTNKSNKDRMDCIDDILRNRRTLFINLDRIFIHTTKHRPKKSKKSINKVIKITDPKGLFPSFYITVVEGIESFIKEVYLKVLWVF